MTDLFKRNLGALDRVLRVFVGTVLLVLGVFAATGEVGVTAIILSFPLLLTGVTGICPAYSLLGISTKRIETCC